MVCLGLEWTLRSVARLSWRGALPADGGLLLAPNHISVLDPLLIGAAVVRAGRIPRFVGTTGVFRIPVVGSVLRFFDHLPLDRAGAGNTARLAAIRDALRAGECVVLYPEGRVTRNQDYWPDRFRIGIVCLAAETGTPIVPVAQWGAQHVIGRSRPAFFRWPPRRARVQVRFGDPSGAAPSVAGRREQAEVLQRRVESMVRQLAGDRRSDDA